MREKRTNVDFSKHEFNSKQTEDFNSWWLKPPNSYNNFVKFTNIDGVCVVTGDRGNFLFCREFQPSEKGSVSDHYWCEKLRTSSLQSSHKFSEELTRKALEEEIMERESEAEQEDHDMREVFTDEEREYLEGCLDAFTGCEFDYLSYAYRNNVGRYSDYEHVVNEKEIDHDLLVVFDAFDEMCLRLQSINKTEK